MNILLSLLSFLTLNMEAITVSSYESNVYIGENYPIIIKTNNCEEKGEHILSFVTYNNDMFSFKHMQFLNGNVCEIVSIEEKRYF